MLRVLIRKLPKFYRGHKDFHRFPEIKSNDSTELMKMNEKLDKMTLTLEKISKDIKENSNICYDILDSVYPLSRIGILFILVYFIVKLIEFLTSL